MTVSTITVTVSMPTSAQMLSTDACLSCGPVGAAFCDCELLAAFVVAVADAFVEEAAAFCAPGTRQEDKGRWGQGAVACGDKCKHSIGGQIVLCTAALRCTCALWRHVCFLLHVCTMKNIPGKCFTVPARVHCVGTRPRTSTRAGREQRVRAGVYVVCLTAL